LLVNDAPASLWLEQIVSINIELIAYITRLSSWGETITQFLEENKKEKALAEEMKKKYGTKSGSHGIIINHISDASTRMSTKFMA
jgi:hypothetical protein